MANNATRQPGSPTVQERATELLQEAAGDFEDYDLDSFALAVAVASAYWRHRHDDLSDLLTRDVPAHLLNPTGWFWPTQAGVVMRGHLATLTVLWRGAGAITDMDLDGFDRFLLRAWDHATSREGPMSLLSDGFIEIERLAAAPALRR